MPASKEREERLARALRQNLKRRKARDQALAQVQGSEPTAPSDDPDGADVPGRNPAQNEN